MVYNNDYRASMCCRLTVNRLFLNNDDAELTDRQNEIAFTVKISGFFQRYHLVFHVFSSVRM